MSKKNILDNVIVKKIKNNNMTPMSLILIIMIIFSSTLSPYFLTKYNLQAIIRDLSFIGMIGVAQSLLLLVGGLDLSVGKIASLCGILAGILMVNLSVNPYLALLLALLFGSIFGLLNGLLITKLKLNSMVATIGMSGVYGGINLVITKGKAVSNVPSEIGFLGKGNILNIPVPFLFTIITLVIVLFFVKKTRLGRYVYAVGNSYEAAKILGIDADKIRLLLHSIVGLISSLAGVLYVARLGSAQSEIGVNWPMNSIASAVIGGVALTGGVGNPAGALLGAAIIVIIQNMIVLFGVSIYWQSAVSGAVVVLAISFGSISSMLKENRRRRNKIKSSIK